MRFDQKMALRGLGWLVIVGFLQMFAQKTGLYWIYPDFDIPMHFLGGVWLGYMATWFLFRFKLITNQDTWTYVWSIGVFGLAIGLGWELFEFGMDVWLDTAMQPSTLDTLLDLVMDLLGVYVVGASLLVSHFSSRQNHEA